MKIIIKQKEEWPKKMVIVLPNFLFKSKFVWKMMIKNNNLEYLNDIKKLKNVVPMFYKTLKKVIKENGHFNLVEVSTESAKVIIRI